MSIPIAAASPWPARCAYLSAAIFITASGTTNIVYGWSKGDSLPTSLIWAGVAGAVAVVFALAWPALIRSVDARRWSAALISLVALFLAGAYSVTAALGSAAGGRANAAATETATTDARNKAQAAYDAAKAELDTLAAVRPRAGLQAQIEDARADLAKLPAARNVAELEALMHRGCNHGTALQAQVKAPCPKYDVEIARAWERKNLTNKIAELTQDAGRAEQRRTEQRTRLNADMAKASAELAKIQPARIANSDAKALTRYLSALGLEVRPDRLNDLLVLLSVLMIETGGGLSLAIGMALQEPARDPALTKASGASVGAPHSRTPRTLTPDAQNAASDQPVSERPASVVQASDVSEWLRMQGGRVHVGMRRLGADLGCSASRAHDEVRRLANAGVLRATPGARGTLLVLMPAGRPN